MNIQEREQMDYELGWDTDLTNAFRHSMSEKQPDDPEIAEELNKGKFVVCLFVEVTCPTTDAGMGHVREFVSSHDTESEAVAARDAVNSEDYQGCSHVVLDPEPVPLS
jgi:hypothetical protein